MRIRAAKLIFLTAALAALAPFAFSIPFQAQAQLGNLGLEYQANIGLGTRNILDIVATIINVLFGLLGTLAVVLILYGGFLYMTSAGEREKVDKARKLLINAAIGLGIILAAYSIAAFIISQLIGATLRGTAGFGAGGAGYEAGSGALGGGIIQAHFPKRNAVDIPRNTSIAITFKEEVKIDQIISGGATSGNLVLPSDPNVDGIFQIYSESTKNHSDKTKGTKRFVAATVSTPDGGKTFVFKPSSLLGNTDEPTIYTVSMTCDLLKKNLTLAFGDFCNPPTGYFWTFQVSTKLDLVPPTVTSVIPFIENDPANTNARNIIVQMNFSEPINPAAASGATADGFSNIIGTVLSQTAVANPADAVAAGTALGGRYEISNGYKTVEFTTNVVCGVNSCGSDVYCMPGNANLAFTIKSPTLGTTAGQPFAALSGTDGIVDMASNGLDGNNDGVAQGSTVWDANHPDTSPPGDSYKWSFYTNDQVDLIPPTVTAYGPQAGQESVDPSTSLTAKFDKLLSSSSVKADSNYGDGYCQCDSNDDCNPNETCSLLKKQCVDSNSERVACYTYLPNTCKLNRIVSGTPVKKTIEEVCIQQEHVTVNQSAVMPLTNQTWYQPGTINTLNEAAPGLSYSTIDTAHGQFLTDTNYGLSYGSGIKDLYQNCYIPNAAPGCTRVLKTGGLPGEFSNTPTVWSGSYPSCDLSAGSTLTTAGSFNLSYVTSRGQNKVQPFTTFASTLNAIDMYSAGSGLAPEFDFLKDAFKPNTATFSLYYDLNGAGATSGYYYLAAFIQRPTPFTTALSAAVSAGDDTLAVKSTAGLPAAGGTLMIESDEVTYSAKSADGITLTGVTGIDSAHDSGKSVQLQESGSFSFNVGPLPDSANARLIYPTTGCASPASTLPCGFSVDSSGGQNTYSAILNWSPSQATDAIIIQIDRGTSLLDFKVVPSTPVIPGDMKMQVFYAGGSVEVPNDQLFEIIQQGTTGESVTPVSLGPTTNDLNLTVNGSGAVNSSPSGTSCGPNCLSFDSNASVTLTPAPEAGGSFSGWSGDCSGTGTCILVMNSTHNVTASFTQLYTVSVTMSGSGSISGSGIDCGVTCSKSFPAGTSITLTPNPDSGWELTSWAGGCPGSGTCTLIVDRNWTLGATFQQAFTISVSKIGNGTVSGGLITCGATCSVSIPAGAPDLSLQANPAPGEEFVSWSGECSSINGNTCVVAIDQSRNVTAEFQTITPKGLSITWSGGGQIFEGSGTLGCSIFGVSCTGSYNTNTAVDLYAVPLRGYQFAGWGGDCAAAGNGKCSLIMNSGKNVTAQFTVASGFVARILTVNNPLSRTKAVGEGFVCDLPTCTYTVPGGVPQVIFPVANSGFLIQNWNSASSTCAQIGICYITLNSNQSVSLSGSPGSIVNPAEVTLNLVGLGQVSFPVAAGSCASGVFNCYVLPKVSMSITASPQLETCVLTCVHTYFYQWQGLCTGNNYSCSFNLTGNNTITALFRSFLYLPAVSGGTVTTSSGYISCGTGCFNYSPNAPITLSATPSAGKSFSNFTGACQTLTTSNSCPLIMNYPYQVGAIFTP